MLQCCRPACLAIVDLGLANFPSCKSEQDKQRNNLRAPKNRPRVNWSEGLRTAQVRKLIQNVLRFCCNRGS